MLIKNILFALLCASGLAAITTRLMPRDLKLPPVNARLELYTDSTFLETVGEVDAEFEEAWRAAEVAPAGRADNWTIIRRISLGLTGTIPSLEEIRWLEQQPPESQIQWWLERLLQDRRFSDYFAERLARSYVGTEDGPFLVYRRRRFVTWLSDQIQENRPYDQLVRDLIAGTGLWTDAPHVNFITVTNDVNGDDQPDEERLAARTARAFLGVRLDCVQCHDDNLGGDWLQQDFQQLAAFYSEANSSLLGVRDQPREYEFTYLGEEASEVVPATVPFLSDLTSQDAEGSRRERLADWVTHPQNEPFRKAIVNRVWAILCGQPLVTPIDSIPLHDSSTPGLLRLGEDFAAHGFDLRRLIRLIVSTRVFQTSSRAAQFVSDTDSHHWARFPLTQLRPEQVAGSLIQASSLRTIDANSHVLVRFIRNDQTRNFVKRFGDTGEDEFDARATTIPQRLLLMNGDLVRERTKDDLVSNAVTRIAALTQDDRRAIEAAFWATLTRRPSTIEQSYFAQRLKELEGVERRKAIEDLYWALFNSMEFQANH